MSEGRGCDNASLARLGSTAAQLVQLVRKRPTVSPVKQPSPIAPASARGLPAFDRASATRRKVLLQQLGTNNCEGETAAPGPDYANVDRSVKQPVAGTDPALAVLFASEDPPDDVLQAVDDQLLAAAARALSIAGVAGGVDGAAPVAGAFAGAGTWPAAWFETKSLPPCLRNVRVEDMSQVLFERLVQHALSDRLCDPHWRVPEEAAGTVFSKRSAAENTEGPHIRAGALRIVTGETFTNAIAANDLAYLVGLGVNSNIVNCERTIRVWKGAIMHIASVVYLAEAVADYRDEMVTYVYLYTCMYMYMYVHVHVHVH